jgi:hypothetical protein
LVLSTGCADINFNEPKVIKKVIRVNKYYCRYYVINTDEQAFNAYFNDSSNKYQIGDTVIVSFNKK